MVESRKFNDKELKLLNSRAGLEMMLAQGDRIQPEKVLKFLKYESHLEKLQEELVKLQTWVIHEKKRICILFEGRDAAGKGGAIRRITHHINPRYYRVVALPKPTEQEKGQWYFQRYVKHLPNPGEITLFDRSWYNRAVVEPVNGFCSEDEYHRFMGEVNSFEQMLVHDGILLFKLYFSISKEEQARRFEEIRNNPLKIWKLSPVDLRAQELWDTYTAYKEQMFKNTNTDMNPWIIIKANKKTTARIKAIEHILSKVDYENKKVLREFE